MKEKMTNAMRSVFDKLTDEQKVQAKACKSMDDFMKLTSEWGIELPDEITDQVSGGDAFFSAMLDVLSSGR